MENLPWEKFIGRYDRPFTLIYLDPPYRGHERDYGKGVFEPADFPRLAQVLGAIRGKFIMSINDTAESRGPFRRFRIAEVFTQYTANAKALRRVRELLISGP